MFSNRLFWICAFIGLALDRLSKILFVVFIFPPVVNSTIPVIPGVFHFTLVFNDGAAFSMFPGGASWLRWLSLGVSIVLMALAWMNKLPTNRWEQAGYGFILAGALGNGIDRFVLNSVVDFLDFRLIRFPVFNLADTFINVGIICLLIATFIRDPKAPPISSSKSHRK